MQRIGEVVKEIIVMNNIDGKQVFHLRLTTASCQQCGSVSGRVEAQNQLQVEFQVWL